MRQSPMTALTISLLCTTSCLAQSGGGLPPAGGTAALSPSDQNFVLKAAQGGLAEMQSAQLAQQRGTSDSVKQFAQRMITDHGRIDDALSKIVAAKGLTPPADPSPADQRQYSLLEAVSVRNFDRAYIRDEIHDHRMMLRLFQQEASSGRDPELRAFAQSTLPTLQAHLSLAQSLRRPAG